MFKQEKRLPAAITQSYVWLGAKWVMSHAPNNIFCQSFLLQQWSLFWSTWQAFYFIPHIFVVFWCIVGAVVPAPRSYKSSKDLKAQDEGGAGPSNGSAEKKDR